jgi:hypothetical protein
MKKPVPTLHAPLFTCGLQVSVNGRELGNGCPPNVKVDENVYTVGVLGVGTKIPNCRTQIGRQKDGCRSGFPVGSRVTSPPGCEAEAVNGTESQSAGNVVRRKMAVSQISFIDLPSNRRMQIV